jgi:hypothetical protein
VTVHENHSIRCIVEVFFVIRHYYLRDKKFDKFQADSIQQIKIIESGASIAASVLKWRNAHEGLLDVIIAGTTTGKDILRRWKGGENFE